MRRFLSTAIALFLFSASNGFAQEKPLLDALVAKGILTQTEAMEIAKTQAGTVVFEKNNSECVKLSSRFQLQYEWTYANTIVGQTPRTEELSDFLVRRMFLQADAKLKGDFDVRFSVELARSEAGSLLTDTYVAKRFDGEYLSGKLHAGYMKPRFAHEDVMSSFELFTIERTIATQYWVGQANGRRLGIGNRYMGVFWFGEVKQIKGLKYWTSITNAYQFAPNDYIIPYNQIDNHLAYWFGSSYDFVGDDYKLTLGFYSSYSSTGNRRLGIEPFGAIWSINPYYAGHYGNFHFWGDFLTSGVQYGKINTDGTIGQACPYGLNFAVEYRFDIGDWGQIAPTFSYCWLDTGGRGVGTRDGDRHSVNLGTYNNAQGFMAGINWYLRGNDLKIQLGFEYGQYSGKPRDRGANEVDEALAIRTQFQIKL